MAYGNVVGVNGPRAGRKHGRFRNTLVNNRSKDRDFLARLANTAGLQAAERADAQANAASSVPNDPYPNDDKPSGKWPGPGGGGNQGPGGGGQQGNQNGNQNGNQQGNQNGNQNGGNPGPKKNMQAARDAAAAAQASLPPSYDTVVAQLLLDYEAQLGAIRQQLGQNRAMFDTAKADIRDVRIQQFGDVQDIMLDRGMYGGSTDEESQAQVIKDAAKARQDARYTFKTNRAELIGQRLGANSDFVMSLAGLARQAQEDKNAAALADAVTGGDDTEYSGGSSSDYAWGGFQNGLIDQDRLATVAGPGGDTAQVAPWVADPLAAMIAAAKRDGVQLGWTGTYRPLSVQQSSDDGPGGRFADPGTSMHGWGLAIDFNNYDKVVEWLNKNGAYFGFVADVPNEPWHWEFRGGKVWARENRDRWTEPNTGDR